jgi:hypothetical protein
VLVASQQVGAPWQSDVVVLHLVVAALLVPVLLAWARHGGRRLLAASAVITASAAACAYLATVRSSDIPIEWVTVIHESLGRKTIMHLYALGVHAGPNFTALLSAIAAEPVTTLHDVVWLNLVLAVVNAVVFLHVALYVVGPVWAVVWTGVFALNPATFLASFSELPTNLLASYFLAGVLAWSTLIDPLPQPRLIRAAAFVACAMLTALVAFTRSEVAFVGVVALAVYGAYALLGPDFFTAAWRWLRNLFAPVLAFFDAQPAAVVALSLLGACLSMTGVPELVRREPSAALYPFNPSILGLFVYLPMLALPIGVSIATFFGFIHAIVHFWKFGGLALSLFLLIRAYFAAQNQYFEMGRYMSTLFPAVFLLALYGKAQLDAIARRFLSINWQRVVHIGYIMTWFTLPLPGVIDFYIRPDFTFGGHFSQLLLDQNTQREVRYLMALVEKSPECVFVARTVKDDAGDPQVGTEYLYVIFGKPLSHPIMVPEKDTSLGDLIARYAAGASCVRLYYGGDCNLTYSDRCENFVAGRRLVGEERFWSRPYNNPRQVGYGAPEIVLGVYAWP